MSWRKAWRRVYGGGGGALFFNYTKCIGPAVVSDDDALGFSDYVGFGFLEAQL